MDVNIECSGRGINNRRARDTNHWNDIPVVRPLIAISKLIVVTRDGEPQISGPEHSAISPRITVRVEGINSVIFGCYDNRVMGAFSRNDETGHIKRLGIDIAVSWILNQPAESGRIHVGCGQQNFIRICSLPGIIVVIGQNVLGRRIRYWEHCQIHGQTVGNTEGIGSHQGVTARRGQLHGRQGQIGANTVGKINTVLLPLKLDRQRAVNRRCESDKSTHVICHICRRGLLDEKRRTGCRDCHQERSAAVCARGIGNHEAVVTGIQNRSIRQYERR